MARRNTPRRSRSRSRNNSSGFPFASLIIAAIIVVALLIAFTRVTRCMGNEPSGQPYTEYEQEQQTGDEYDAQPQEDSASASSGVYSDLLYVVNPDDVHPVMLSYTGFTVAFCPAKHQPYYVTWSLEPGKTDGPAKRKDADFAEDPNVVGCATLDDYRKSGYDRGHLCPAADCRWSFDAMRDCHYLTNMTPQHHKLNAGAWKTIEENCRDWAEKYGTLYIVAGPVLSDRLTRTIGSSPVPVPDRFFKVIICPDANLGIGFIMPNEYVQGGAQATVTTIDQVETVTGFDFFSALPDDVEANLEKQHSLAAWNH